jgi:hypothetical protein
MNSKSNSFFSESFKKDPKPKIGDSDGITENALNLALFALCVLFLSLSMVSSSMSLYELEASRLESQSAKIQELETKHQATQTTGNEFLAFSGRLASSRSESRFNKH